MDETKKEHIFVDGMRFEKPRDGSPEFIKGRISIEASKLIPFIEANKNFKGWLNIDLKKSNKGNLYLELNTYNRAEINKTDDVEM